jgi:hypothetical protein
MQLMVLSSHSRVSSRRASLHTALLCGALVFLLLARVNSFSFPHLSGQQSTVWSDTRHPKQCVDRVEQQLSTPTETFVLSPQLASLRLSSANDDSLPVLHSIRSAANRSPPQS